MSLKNFVHGPQLVGDSDGNIYLKLIKDKRHAFWEDKKVLITGIGNSGTNVVTEVVRASGYFNFTEFVEDRMSWQPFGAGLVLLLTHKYGAKMACQRPYFNVADFDRNMEKFPNLRVLVSLRHPLDTSLSNIYRELPIVMGGDSKENRVENVCTDENRIDGLIKVWNEERAPVLAHILGKHRKSGRVIAVRLEDLINSPVVITQGIATWLEVDYNDEMSNPWDKVRHAGQKARYNGVLDKSQIEKYKRWDEAYNGFYSDKQELVIRLAKGLAPIASYFGYETDMDCFYRKG